MRLKASVKLRGATPQIVLAALIAQSVYERHGHQCVITSCSEGRHPRRSAHYAGAALDLQTSHIKPPSARFQLFTDLQQALNGEFVCLLAADYIHVQYQPEAE